MAIEKELEFLDKINKLQERLLEAEIVIIETYCGGPEMVKLADKYVRAHPECLDNDPVLILCLLELIIEERG